MIKDYYLDYSSGEEQDIKSNIEHGKDNDVKEQDFVKEITKELKENAKIYLEKNLNSDNGAKDLNNEKIDDDLLNLYDPDSDEENEKYINDMRQSIVNKAAKSDATLNCPCCMTLLCLDCQRHEIYRTQYRAMFVFNCSVDNYQKVEYKSEKNKRRKGLDSLKKTLKDDPETYCVVKCSNCWTEVAVIDSNEVYHFYNVIASY